MNTHWTEGGVYLPNNLGHDIKEHATFRALFAIMTFSNCCDPDAEEQQGKQFTAAYLSEIARISKSAASKALIDLSKRGYLKKVRDTEHSKGVYELITHVQATIDYWE